jgi:hypothetical protein
VVKSAGLGKPILRLRLQPEAVLSRPPPGYFSLELRQQLQRSLKRNKKSSKTLGLACKPGIERDSTLLPRDQHQHLAQTTRMRRC